jgi:hypothetical protein
MTACSSPRYAKKYVQPTSYFAQEKDLMRYNLYLYQTGRNWIMFGIGRKIFSFWYFTSYLE